MNQRELLKLLIESAPKLRAAGVLSLELEGLSATLRPEDAAPAQFVDDEPEDMSHPDPLLDPATYIGGVVPTFKPVGQDDNEADA